MEWQQIFALTVTYALTLHSATRTAQHPTPQIQRLLRMQCNETLMHVAIFAFVSFHQRIKYSSTDLLEWSYAGAYNRPIRFVSIDVVP